MPPRRRTFNVVNKSVRKIDAMALALGRPMYRGGQRSGGHVAHQVPVEPARACPHHVDQRGGGGGHARRALPCCTTATCRGFRIPRPARAILSRRRTTPTCSTPRCGSSGDRVAAVAAETVEIAEQALAAIKVEYEVLPAVLNQDDAMKPGAPVIHDEPDTFAKIPVPYEPQKNMAAFVGMDVGSLEAGLAAADAVVDHSYYAHYAQHCPIEPHVAFAYIEPEGRSGDRDQHAGALPRAPHRGPVPRNSGAPNSRHQAPHRRRLRGEAGGVDGGRGRHDGPADAASVLPRLHARGGAGQLAHAASDPHADAARREKGRHDHGAWDGLPVQHRRVRLARADGGVQLWQQDAAALPRAKHPLHRHRGVHEPARGRRVSRIRRDAIRLRGGKRDG
jgi:hypothetical protein